MFDIVFILQLSVFGFASDPTHWLLHRLQPTHQRLAIVTYGFYERSLSSPPDVSILFLR
jgi:hypothetical protein